MIPMKLALEPPCWVLAETNVADGGMERKGKERDKARHAVTHQTTLTDAAWPPETDLSCIRCLFKKTLPSISQLQLLATVASRSRMCYHYRTNAEFFIVI